MNGFAVQAWAVLICLIVALFTFDLLVAVRLCRAKTRSRALTWAFT